MVRLRPDPHPVLRFTQTAASGSAIAILFKRPYFRHTVKVEGLGRAKTEGKNALGRARPQDGSESRTGQLLVTGRKSKTKAQYGQKEARNHEFNSKAANNEPRRGRAPHG